MAYTRDWDETDPDGAIVAAADIDREIREFKTDVRERLETISSFGSDNDPMTLDEGTARITVDTAANRPSDPSNDSLEGEAYFETDTGDLYFAVPDGSGGLEWELANQDTTGTAAIDEAGVAEYNDLNSAGNKETESGSFTDILSMFVSGETDGNGHLTVDLSELSGSWDAGFLWAEELVANPGAQHVGDVANIVLASINTSSTGPGSFDLLFKGYDGVDYVNSPVSCSLLIPFA